MIPLFFAPMEGITDNVYRHFILEHFPEWDYLVTDFFRLPTNGIFSTKSFKKHIGEEILATPHYLEKTISQILFNDRTNIEECISKMSEVGITRLDLNYGCPSKKVNTHGGGAYLLQDLPLLKSLTARARKSFTGTLSAKIRTGYHHSNDFHEIIKILTSEGIDFITVHGRNRDQMYEGLADWKLIRDAAKKAYIIGNGDIDNFTTLRKLESENIFYGLMVGRGAIANPWMAKEKKEGKSYSADLVNFFSQIKERYKEEGLSEKALLQRLKAISYYMSNNQDLLRVNSSSEFFEKLAV